MSTTFKTHNPQLATYLLYHLGPAALLGARRASANAVVFEFQNDLNPSRDCHRHADDFFANASVPARKLLAHTRTVRRAYRSVANSSGGRWSAEKETK